MKLRQKSEPFRTLGADAVAMSLVPETIAAVHCGIEVLGLSFLSNLAAGVSGNPLSGEEVNQAAEQSRPMLTKLLRELLYDMNLKNLIFVSTKPAFCMVQRPVFL